LQTALAQSKAARRRWEIHFGPDNRFRVLYDIDEERRQVQIVAIGEKEGNRLIVSGEEMDG
jgi:hypothetical protein